MATVMNTPGFMNRPATPDLLTEQPDVAQVRPGFWRTFLHRLMTHLTFTPAEPYTSVHHGQRPFELPIDRFVREYPSTSVSVLAMM